MSFLAVPGVLIERHVGVRVFEIGRRQLRDHLHHFPARDFFQAASWIPLDLFGAEMGREGERRADNRLGLRIHERAFPFDPVVDRHAVEGESPLGSCVPHAADNSQRADVPFPTGDPDGSCRAVSHAERVATNEFPFVG